MKIAKVVTLGLVAILASACAQGSNFSNEFAGMQIASVGTTNTSQMSNRDLKDAIDRAYLEGELTSEQARIAHTQLDVKGHLTAEQIAVINRDRLASRHKYESNKEELDVYRDVTRSGSSMIGDIRDIKSTFGSIFK